MAASKKVLKSSAKAEQSTAYAGFRLPSPFAVGESVFHLQKRTCLAGNDAALFQLAHRGSAAVHPRLSLLLAELQVRTGGHSSP